MGVLPVPVIRLPLTESLKQQTNVIYQEFCWKHMDTQLWICQCADCTPELPACSGLKIISSGVLGWSLQHQRRFEIVLSGAAFPPECASDF